LNGTQAEVTLRHQLRDLTRGMTDDERVRTEALLRGNKALRQQKEAADEMKKLYADIGMSIKEGVVGAIQGAVDGTKSLQEVASNLLQNIANKLLDVAINLALFGAMSGTGTGGGLLGFLYKEQAKGGAWENGIQAFARGGIVNKPTLLPLAGEAGPEAIMPLKRLPSGRLGVEAAGGGGGGGVNVVVNVDAKGSRVEGDQQQGAALGRAISAAVQAELVKQQRPGGLLAGAR
jgi:Phage-related minor tail protein